MPGSLILQMKPSGCGAGRVNEIASAKRYHWISIEVRQLPQAARDGIQSFRSRSLLHATAASLK